MQDFQENIKAFISGALAGSSQVLVMQPFQKIKVRQVNQLDGSIKYHGFIQSIKTIIKQQGWKSFYQGTRSPLIGYSLQCSLQFGFNKYFRRLLSKINNSKQNFYTLLSASMLTGVPSAVSITPADHIRILIQKQMHGKKQYYKGQMQAAKDILKRHGIKGLYLGFNCTLIREIFAMGFYFTCFQLVKKQLISKKQGYIQGKLKIMTAGGIAGLSSWIFTYPLDFIKTKLQSQDLDNKQYQGIVNCFKKNYQHHGWRIFTRGLFTVCIRAIPVNGVAFLIQQEAGILLNRKQIDQ